MSFRIKPVQKNQGIANGTPGGLAQQQATAVCDISAQLQQYQQFLGKQQLRWPLVDTGGRAVAAAASEMCFSAADTSGPLPVFADVEVQDSELPDGVQLEHLKAFQALYREHCEVGTPRQRAPFNSEAPQMCQELGDFGKPVCDSLTGHFRRYGQPSVHSRGDTLEIFLEVQ